MATNGLADAPPKPRGGVPGGVDERLLQRVDCVSLDTAVAIEEPTSCNLLGLEGCLFSASGCPCIQDCPVVSNNGGWPGWTEV